MTLQQLNELRKESGIIKNIKEEIETFADSIPGGNISGMPSAKSVGNSKEKRYISYLADKEKLQKRYEKMLYKHSETIEYINQIQDETLYNIFRYRFIKNYHWNKVAMLIGGGNTEDTVRMQVNYYLKTHK